MIKLKVDGYCHDCPDFDARVNNKVDELTTGDEVVIKVVNTTVTCAHATRCKAIKRYLERAGKDVKPIV